MKEIHIECAGAGKTYGIAKKIIDMVESCPQGMRIYAITYTNYAVRQIKSEIINQLHYIPDQICIITVHSFLLEHIIYPYSKFIKNQVINSCCIEKLPSNYQWSAKRRKKLKDNEVVHSKDVSQYAKSIIVPMSSDSKKVIQRKKIVLDYFASDIYCLFVDEAQDMDKYFFELMYHIIDYLQNYYFVGDPNQALWELDQYKSFSEKLEKEKNIELIKNMTSRRLPQSVVPLCNSILYEESQITSCNTNDGEIAYVLVSELKKNELAALSKNNVFSIIKSKNNVFSTSVEKGCLTHEFKEIIAQKYPNRDIDAMISAIIEIIQKEGLSKCLNKLNIRISSEEYAKLSLQFSKGDCNNVCVHSIHKIKGLEDETVYFIVTNSLMKIFSGEINNHNKETNLLYVALTRVKSRLLLVVNDDDVMRRHYNDFDNSMNAIMKERDIPKANKELWFK